MLRRQAQMNAASQTGSPVSPNGPASAPDSPLSGLPRTPTRKARVSYFDSPSTTPSISSSVPFDWEAARSRKPPPYASPLPKRKARQSLVAAGSVVKRVVRKKGIVERIKGIPSRIAFEISIFPQQVPLPSPRTSACLIGGGMHLFHLYLRAVQGSAIPESELTWEDMYREHHGVSWFDWTVPLSLGLLLLSAMNVVYLFTRIKLYHLHQQPDLVSSPNASFVPVELDFEPLEPPSVFSRVRTGTWRFFVSTFRFLLNLDSRSSTPANNKLQRVQQLEVWFPGPMELTLFAVYSPAHALLWMAVTTANWMLIFTIMASISALMYGLIRSYEALLKDRSIIAAEVMHEYDEKFVYPRIHPVKRDVAVMTHESECVNVWEE